MVFGYWDVVICLVRFESYIGGNCYIFSGLRDVIFFLWYWNGKSSGIGDNFGGKYKFVFKVSFLYYIED